MKPGDKVMVPRTGGSGRHGWGDTGAKGRPVYGYRT